LHAYVLKYDEIAAGVKLETVAVIYVRLLASGPAFNACQMGEGALGWGLVV
jgi:hypothetical protein